MSLNPYASDDFNRIQTKSELTFEEQKAKKEYDENNIDNPLIEGQKLEMKRSELKSFTKAMETE